LEGAGYGGGYGWEGGVGVGAVASGEILSG